MVPLRFGFLLRIRIDEMPMTSNPGLFLLQIIDRMGERVWAIVTRTTVCFLPFVRDMSRMKHTA